MGDLKEDG